MPNLANNNKLIPSIIKHGRTLATLLNEAKTPPSEEVRRAFHDNVMLLIQEVENVQQLPAFFPEKSISKVLDKIQVTLHKFKELDSKNAKEYEQLAIRVDDCKAKRKPSPAGSSATSVDSKSPTGDSSVLLGGSTVDDDDDSPQQDQFDSLSPEEMKCLFCFCLFDAGREVEKREPIHLWVAMNLVDPKPLDGDEMMDKLVAKGFIERTIRNKRLYNRYKMNEKVRDMVVNAMKIKSEPDTSLSTIYQDEKSQQQQQQPSDQLEDQQQLPPAEQQQQQTQQQQQLSESRKISGTLVLNKSEDSLQASTLQQISKRKDNVIKVLHLGIWSHNSEKYIVVEEVEALKGLAKHAGEVTLLSLEGISGIVKLPDFVYKLDNLKVLDLRGCPNLESLSEGIDSLKKLTHLDLSECYLLDHFPKGIASLTELRVLKGFIINPDSQNNENGNGDRSSRNKNRNGEETISSSQCTSFCELRGLKKLKKLTIRTRRTDFPTSNDSETLWAMQELENLRIAWVWNSTDVSNNRNVSGKFPPSLKKLELQATPEETMWRLLRLISNDMHNPLEKLYIRGGRLGSLGMMNHFCHVQKFRLRYLRELHIDWIEFRKFFPNLARLEVLECPNLIFFPCDENGVWENSSDY